MLSLAGYTVAAARADSEYLGNEHLNNNSVVRRMSKLGCKEACYRSTTNSNASASCMHDTCKVHSSKSYDYEHHCTYGQSQVDVDSLPMNPLVQESSHAV